MVPIKEETSTTQNNAIETVIDKCISCFNTMLNKKTNVEIAKPLITDTTKPFPNLSNLKPISLESRANDCTIIEEDCMPTFPPVAVIRGIKKAIAVTCVITFSNKPINCAPKIPPSIPTINQGNLLLDNSHTEPSSSASS